MSQDKPNPKARHIQTSALDQDKIKGIVKEAVDFAEESPFPSNDALYNNVYVEDYPFIKE